VTAQRDDRAGVLMHAARRTSDVTVVAALHGGNTEGVCSYTIGLGELAKGRTGQGHAESEHAPAYRAYAA
jgi:hypothetical protein